ncbi:MAG: hypothetical protein JNM13_04075, partial [Hyphomicrobiaceae bacterium]|nr:hypothetical protein [Hyphomicrobiaceae bacterium]
MQLTSGVAGRMVEVAAPPSGSVRVVDVGDAKTIKFLFSFKGVKIIVLDVDIVLALPDGAKVILPNLAMRLVTNDPADMEFMDDRILGDAVMAQVGDVKLADPSQQIQIASIEAAEAKPADEQPPAAPPAPAAAGVPFTPPPLDTEGKYDEEPAAARPAATSNNIAMEEETATSSAAAPVNINTNVDVGPGQAPIADLDVELLGVATRSSEGLAGGGARIYGAAAIVPAETDTDYAIQSTRETISGTDFGDIIYAENPNTMPEGTFLRRLDISIDMPTDGWVATGARVLSLPTGFAVLNGTVTEGYTYVSVDPDVDNRLLLDLRYVLPTDGAVPDPEGFLSVFTIQIQFYVDKGDGTTVLVNGTKTFGIREVNSEDDAVYVNEETGQEIIVLPSNPAGNVITAGAGDDTIFAGAGADSLAGGAGSDTLAFTYSHSAVTIDLGAGTVVGGYGKGDVFAEFENLIGTRFADKLTGDAGSNTIEGAAGADTIDGAGGQDVVSFAGSSAAVTVNLGAGTASGGDADGDSFTNIEDVLGSAHADTLTGSSAANTLMGGAGNDLLEGGAGADRLDGGDGIDQITYANSTAGVTISLDGSAGVGGDAEGDSLVSIERITGSAHADRFVGSTASVTIDGAGGDDLLIGSTEADSLTGGAGADTLAGRGGADRLDGGDGSDTADYTASLEAVTVDLANGTGTGGDAEGDTLARIERIVGSALRDVLSGSAAADTIEGGGDDDTLTGRGGADTLIGGAGTDTADYSAASDAVTIDLDAGTGLGGDAEGDVLAGIERVLGSIRSDRLSGSANGDTLDGGIGDDTLSGRGGADRLIGGLGVDTADYSASAAAVTVDLLTGIGGGGDADGDLLAGIERIVGSDHADRLTGDMLNNTLLGGLGDDTLEGGQSADVLDGGDGADTATYQSSGTAVTVSLATGIGLGGDAEGDRLANVEHLTGSLLGDVLTGEDGANTLDGGEGNDTLDGGLGADVLIGGAGQDVADYHRSTSAVSIDLTTGNASGGLADGDQLVSIERLIGTDYADTLRGNGQVNSLMGGAGDDRIEGEAGDDTLIGGTGDDRLIGGADGDMLIGGDGTDTADYSGSVAGVTVNLDGGLALGGDAAGDTLAEIENVTGSALADRLTGDDAANRLDGLGGDDTLSGGAGADILDGGDGRDTADYSLSSAAITIDLIGNVHSGGSAAGDTLLAIERIIGSSFDDLMQGAGGDDDFVGGLGDDTLRGGAGADTLAGGSGDDTADYATSAAAVTVDLATGLGAGGDAQGDRLNAIERVIGSALDDRLTGDANANRLDGGAGADRLEGAAGADTLAGGTGDDTLTGGA